MLLAKAQASQQRALALLGACKHAVSQTLWERASRACGGQASPRPRRERHQGMRTCPRLLLLVRPGRRRRVSLDTHIHEHPSHRRSTPTPTPPSYSRSSSSPLSSKPCAPPPACSPASASPKPSWPPRSPPPAPSAASKLSCEQTSVIVSRRWRVFVGQHCLEADLAPFSRGPSNHLSSDSHSLVFPFPSHFPRSAVTMKLGSSAQGLVGSDIEFPEFDPLVSLFAFGNAA